MPADQIRNRTVGCKMSDSEYERLSAVVESEGMTLGEWCREVLLERAEGRKPSAIEETLLAEVLALRTILAGGPHLRRVSVACWLLRIGGKEQGGAPLLLTT